MLLPKLAQKTANRTAKDESYPCCLASGCDRGFRSGARRGRGSCYEDRMRGSASGGWLDSVLQ